MTIGRRGHRQVQRSFFAPTAAEAEHKRDEAIRQLSGGIILAGERVTVERYLLDWLQVKQPSVRRSTWTRYRGIVLHNIIPAIGAVPLAKLTPEAVERMLAGLGSAPRTAHHVRAVLRTALARAVKHGALLRNVAEHADAPKLEEDEQRILTADEIHRLLEQVRGNRWEALYVLAIATGLRQGELLGLRWQDIDLDAGSLRVVNQMYLRQIVPPKTKKSRRMLGLSASVLAALHSHQLRQEQQRRFLLRGDWGNQIGLVFTNGMGGPVHGPHVTREFQRHLARAGIERLPFHALRHSAASMLMSVGVDEKVRQQILGHSNVAMTRHYTHVLPEALRDAAERMEKVIAG